MALFNAADFIKASRYSALGLAYIASYLKRNLNFKDIHILEGDVLSKIKRIKPDLVGISSVTQDFTQAIDFSKLIKKEYNNIPVIVGGMHISSLPHTLPKCFDLAVLGEGEQTMLELVRDFDKYGLEKKRLYQIKGIAFHDKDGISITGPREVIRDIDFIPFPDRELIFKTSFPNVITSRGCPYKCVFCISSKFWGKPRFHSPGYVIAEIEQLISKYHAAHISIWDDLFVSHRQRIREIADLIQERGINRKVSFGCALRANLVDDELCNILKKMNVKRISIGLESGSERVLKYLKKNTATVEQNKKAVRLCKEYGFYTTGTFMVGSPYEDENDLHQTLTLIRSLRLDGGGTISLATPLPGTGFWDYAVEHGLVSEDMDFSGLGIMTTDFSDPQNFKGVLLTDRISKDTFFRIALEMQKEANRFYVRGFLRKEYFSLKTVKFIFSRPKEVFAIIKYILRFLLQKASVMERYIFYYRKST
jgi:radical SAM superfamily enzyme YgiQ (UPF0313 family)